MSDKERWWVIEQEELLDMLKQCCKGEDPNMVILEAYANSESKDVNE